uniref:Uncharacterized protein n=1 Tax=Ditylum brightwellii TaxID=49249 RepID=A0A7S2EPV4_9STRA
MHIASQKIAMRIIPHLLPLLFPSAAAWSAASGKSGIFQHTATFQLSMVEEPVADAEVGIEKSEAEEHEPQWGVSFIGGDPCGSRYNTDPHDAQVEKPGMPASMKERIRLLAEQKKREAEDQGNE